MSDHSRRWLSAQRDRENRCATRLRAATPSLGGKTRLVEQSLHGRAQRADIPWGDEHAAVCAKYLWNSADVCRDAWQAGPHGLEQGKRQVFVQ